MAMTSPDAFAEPLPSRQRQARLVLAIRLICNEQPEEKKSSYNSIVEG
ncbi:hypothetical protein [Bradyrhizobium canariense]|nr:hypothetical protein [Bradyrhizobium canariense]